MTETNQNIEVYRGDSLTFFVALTDAVTGDPLDLNAVTSIRWRLALTSHSLRALVSKDLDAGITAVEGGVNIELSTAETDHDYGIYYHELKIITGAQVATALTGNFTIRRSLDMAEQMPAQLALVGSSDMANAPDTLGT